MMPEKISEMMQKIFLARSEMNNVLNEIERARKVLTQMQGFESHCRSIQRCQQKDDEISQKVWNMTMRLNLIRRQYMQTETEALELAREGNRQKIVWPWVIIDPKILFPLVPTVPTELIAFKPEISSVLNISMINSLLERGEKNDDNQPS